jgi:signal transduction histidine kinase
LEALLRQVGPDSTVSKRIAEIIEMTETTVCNLRSLAKILKEKRRTPGNFLVAAVEKQTEQLRRFYDINVEIKSDISPRLKGRLAVEAFQIISEGLSNVLRHTTAKNAFVNIACEDSRVLIQIGNEMRPGIKDEGAFMPRSITERAQVLGGEAVVAQSADGFTVVNVAIPYASNQPAV